MCQIVYEDNHLLVVIKPQNVPVQEDESKDEDLLNKLKRYLKEKYNKPGNVYLGLVHRLDRPTGGVMVFAKTSKSASRLCEQIKTDDFEKKYLCVVYGKPRLDRARLVNYLKKDEINNVVNIVGQLETGAKKAELDYKVLESNDNKSLVEINLLTGRTHQIRVQMSTIGNAVYGDTKYGKIQKANTKMALWAYELKFVHPVTKQKMTFRVFPPISEKPWCEFNYFKKVD